MRLFPFSLFFFLFFWSDPSFETIGLWLVKSRGWRGISHFVWVHYKPSWKKTIPEREWDLLYLGGYHSITLQLLCVCDGEVTLLCTLPSSPPLIILLLSLFASCPEKSFWMLMHMHACRCAPAYVCVCIGHQYQNLSFMCLLCFLLLLILIAPNCLAENMDLMITPLTLLVMHWHFIEMIAT